VKQLSLGIQESSIMDLPCLIRSGLVRRGEGCEWDEPVFVIVRPRKVEDPLFSTPVETLGGANDWPFPVSALSGISQWLWDREAEVPARTSPSLPVVGSCRGRKVDPEDFGRAKVIVEVIVDELRSKSVSGFVYRALKNRGRYSSR
jgi:hypothetical protein